LSSGAYALSTPFTERREYRAIAAASTSLLIGAGKEGYDALGYGDPSWRDFAWDVAGTAVGVLVAYAVDCIITDPAKRSSTSTAATSPLVITF
jgi:putative lipoprotein